MNWGRKRTGVESPPLFFFFSISKCVVEIVGSNREERAEYVTFELAGLHHRLLAYGMNQCTQPLGTAKLGGGRGLLGIEQSSHSLQGAVTDHRNREDA